MLTQEPIVEKQVVEKGRALPRRALPENFMRLFSGLCMPMLALVLVLVLALTHVHADLRNSVNIGMVLEPPHLDPTAGAAGAIDEVVYANLFEGLTRIDANGKVHSALARSWYISTDGLTYLFDLARGVRFHDGSDFDADDVVFSLERAMAANSQNAQKGLFSKIVSVKALSSHQVEVILESPASNFLFNLGWGDAVIVAPESAGNNRNNPIGTGPFKFSRRVIGDRIELELNEAYHGSKPLLSSVTFKFISDPNAAMAALLAGEVDAFTNFPVPELVPVFENDKRFNVVQGTTEGETILALNNGREPWSNLLVRQAIAHAVDRQSLIDGAMYGFGTAIGTHFPPHHQAYVDLVDLYPYDLEMASFLLERAGYGGGGLSATLKLPPPPYAQRSGEIIAAQLAKVGIEIEIIPLDWAQWLSEVFRNKDYDMTIVSHTEPMDIGIYARDNYYFNYKNEAIKALMLNLEAETDPGQRLALFKKAQQIISRDAVNTYLFQLPKIGIWKSDLQGLWHNQPIQANDLTEVSWKK